VLTEAAALVLRTERLAGILDQRKAMLLGDRAQRIELARVAVDVDGDDRLRARRHRRLDGRGVEVERARVDVGEDGHAALVDEAVRRCRERVRRRDDLVARADARGDAEEMQPGGAGRDGGRVRCADLLGERLLEAVDHRAE